MITREQLISLGTLRRPMLRDLSNFIFVLRDGLFVPFRAEQAVDLLGEEVFVLRTDVQQDGEEVFTWQDLVGCEVIDVEDGSLGTIDYVDESTLNTLATLNDGRLIPLHEDFIVKIDTKQRILRVNLPFSL